MNRLIFSVLFTVGSLLGYRDVVQAQVPTKLWDKSFGGNDDDQLTTIQQTSDGGYVLGGSSNSGLSGDKTQPSQGDDDYWVVKLDATGTKEWDRTFGGTAHEALSVIQQTSDGGYLLAGSSASGQNGDKTQPSQGDFDYWVVKLDASGTKEWDRTFGGKEGESLNAMQLTSDGGCILGGSAFSLNIDKMQAGQGYWDYWVIKLDANGTKQWDRFYGGSRADYLNDLQQTSDGGYILGGTSHSEISGDKTQLGAGFGSGDYWVIKLDATGTKEWDRTLWGRAHDDLSAVQQTSDGGYIVGGTSESWVSGDKTQGSQGYWDYWVVKLDASGSKQWDRTFGGRSTDHLRALQQTRDGGYLLGGYSDSDRGGDKTQPNLGFYDYWLVKLTADGTKEWDRSYGGNGDDFLSALQQTSDGSYLLGGRSKSGSSSDPTQVNQGDNDYWVVKLGPAPLVTTTTAPLHRPPLIAYPNPVSSSLTLRGPAGTPYQLLNQLGQVVRTGTVSAQPVDVQALPAGLYLLRDQTSGRTTHLLKK